MNFSFGALLRTALETDDKGEVTGVMIDVGNGSSARAEGGGLVVLADMAKSAKRVGDELQADVLFVL